MRNWMWKGVKQKGWAFVPIIHPVSFEQAMERYDEAAAEVLVAKIQGKRLGWEPVWEDAICGLRDKR